MQREKFPDVLKDGLLAEEVAQRELEPKNVHQDSRGVHQTRLGVTEGVDSKNVQLDTDLTAALV